MPETNTTTEPLTFEWQMPLTRTTTIRLSVRGAGDLRARDVDMAERFVALALETLRTVVAKAENAESAEGRNG